MFYLFGGTFINSHIKHYGNGWALEDGLEAYFIKYNRRRRHSKIEQQYPYERYIKSMEEYTAKM